MFPDQVILDEKNTEKLTQLYRIAYRDILSEIRDASSFGSANRRALLAQIQEILKDLGGSVNDIIDTELEKYYKDGVEEASQQLEHIGADVQVSTGFNRIHQEAIAALIDDTQEAFGQSVQGVNRSAQTLLGKAVRDQLTEQIALGKISGKTLQTIKQNVVGYLETQGLDAIKDKGGRGWALDRYAEMLIRTKAVEARNRGMANRIAENGYDLVQVSSHGATDQCGKWEGKILSVSGEDSSYPTLATAEADGLFHPNCRHAINVLVPSLAIKTSAYDSQSGKYLESTQAVLQKKLAKAQKFNPTFIEKVGAIAAANNWTYKIGRVKDEARAIEKIVNDYALDASQLKDANRSVVFVNDPRNIKPIVSQIEKEFTVIRVKDDLQAKGYRKALINVKTPAGSAEIQVTTQEFWNAKKQLGGDELYKKVRAKVEDWEQFEKQMLALYDDAAKAVDARLNAS